MCGSFLDAQEHHPLSTEKSSFFLDIFRARTRHFRAGIYHFLWVEYGPVCDSLVIHQAYQGGGGSFFGTRFVAVGIGVPLEPCDSSDDDGDDAASDVCSRLSMISDMKSRNDL